MLFNQIVYKIVYNFNYFEIQAIEQTLNECDPTSCNPCTSPTCRYHVPIDVNIFDGVQNNVHECLEYGPYNKFFESTLYIDYVNVSILVHNKLNV